MPESRQAVNSLCDATDCCTSCDSVVVNFDSSQHGLCYMLVYLGEPELVDWCINGDGNQQITLRGSQAAGERDISTSALKAWNLRCRYAARLGPLVKHVPAYLHGISYFADTLVTLSFGNV